MTQEKLQSVSQKVVILGTGGTIAGLSLVPGTGGAYRAAQVGVDALLEQAARSERPGSSAGQPSEAAPQLIAEQVAQVDSKDMTEALWQRLLARLHELQQDPTVQAIVMTHGTDTLEETGFLLQACWPQGKPVVLTCAMRPSDAPDADGPANLRDAIALARTPGLRGVLMVCDGQVFEGHVFQKLRTQGVQPFEAEPMGALGTCREGLYKPLRPVDAEHAYPSLDNNERTLLLSTPTWPRVEIVMNHAGADGRIVQALLMQSAGMDDQTRLRGIVLSGTGQGTCSERLAEALKQAQSQDVVVWRTSRATWGGVRTNPGESFRGVSWSPVKARVALMLHLLTGRA